MVLASSYESRKYVAIYLIVFQQDAFTKIAI